MLPLWADAHPANAGINYFELAALLVSITALFAYINNRFIRLPPSIGVMALALAFSLAITGIGLIEPRVEQFASTLVEKIPFNETVMQGMLGFLLFAGALHVNLADLSSRKVLIAILATVGVVLTILIIGALAYLILTMLANWAFLKTPPQLLYCFLFGAIIAPTDPIAVLAMLKQIGAPKQLEVTIAGESLFNDGVGVVIFLGLLQAATSNQPVTFQSLSLAFLQEGVGGAVFGFVIGMVFYYLFRSVDSYTVEVLLSLALVAGGYALAQHWHLSGPIAMVVAGLLIGNHGRMLAMSDITREHLDTFWELIDEILNALLFVLLGLEVLALHITGRFLLVGLLLIPVVLFARGVSVTLPIMLMRLFTSIDPRTARLLTWGGLRGGLSVALAFSIPSDATDREWILAGTYVVVAFSVLVQGLTVGPLMRRWLPQTPEVEVPGGNAWGVPPVRSEHVRGDR